MISCEVLRQEDQKILQEDVSVRFECALWDFVLLCVCVAGSSPCARQTFRGDGLYECYALKST